MVDIDSIRLVLNTEAPASALETLHNYQFTTNAQGEYHHKARLHNLGIYSLPERTVISGSLSKLVYGTNLVRFDYRDVAPRLADVAARLGLPVRSIHEARVTQLDYGVCAEVSQPVADYTRRLVPPPRTTLRQHGSTTAFHQRQREVAFYDKRAEVLAKGGAVDGAWGPHIVRFEVRLRRAVSRQLRRAVRGADLSDAALYTLLGERLLAHLRTVPFEERAVLPVTTSPRTLERALARCGLDAAGGLGEMLGTIDAHRQERLVTREQASRQRSFVRTLHADERYRPHPLHPLRAELAAAIYTAIHTP